MNAKGSPPPSRVDRSSTRVTWFFSDRGVARSRRGAGKRSLGLLANEIVRNLEFSCVYFAADCLLPRPVSIRDRTVSLPSFCRLSDFYYFKKFVGGVVMVTKSESSGNCVFLK
ncbi:hypothetical protein CDAR_271911 [Caerostris darwini]|uniref:Uncharacterized protein n=1 Tax=Caerostris darwini TaxID=1538125 RepID=A0AAV4W8Y7_9ARAC|nr:hypothetical protein CDAR_271911 [Caerostris darwini]